MTQTEGRRRGSRTRIDRTNRNILIGGAGAILLAIGALIAVLLVTDQGANSHRVDVVPRNLDLWAVYPDGRVEFATLFYMGDPANPTESIQTLTAAGPLIAGADSVLRYEVIGGDDAGVEVRQGPGQDANLQYQLFSITRPPSADPYGVDVLVSTSPYLSQTASGGYEIALGNGDAGAYSQVIVAVAIPNGSTLEDTPELTPYRDLSIGGWHVYYFDTTQASATASIRMSFTPGSNTPKPPDVKVVDKRR
jgi:hypothetical protein